MKAIFVENNKMKIIYVEIHSGDKMWVINDGEYIIGLGETTKYAVSDYDAETVYENDDFEQCLIWVATQVWSDFVSEKQKQ